MLIIVGRQFTPAMVIKRRINNGSTERERERSTRTRFPIKVA